MDKPKKEKHHLAYPACNGCFYFQTIKHAICALPNKIPCPVISKQQQSKLKKKGGE
jgi:hypothetical protein